MICCYVSLSTKEASTANIFSMCDIIQLYPKSLDDALIGSKYRFYNSIRLLLPDAMQFIIPLMS